MEDAKWITESAERIQKIVQSMDKRKVKKYKVNILSRIVLRLHEFSLEGCKDCENLKDNINDLILFLEQPDDMKNRQYKSTLRLVMKHLMNKHSLVMEGTYLGQWVAIGLIFGAAFVSFNSMAISLGLLFGVIVGSRLDLKAKKEGKVI